MGLAIEQTGKYVSERHYEASQTKLTAGEAAKKASKDLDRKVSAKELVAAYKLLNGCESEWHHSGFYKPQGSRKSTMGRTFFFDEDQVADVVSHWSEVAVKLQEKADEKKKAAETIVKGFYFLWESDYSGRFGKKRNYKVMHAYEGNLLNVPNKFKKITDNATFANVKAADGKAYYGWEEPRNFEFETKKENL